MAVLSSGTLSDRPWGMTLATVGRRRVTGEVIVLAEGRRYVIGFAQGAVVSAVSPLASDSGVRLAHNSGLISAGQVGELGRRPPGAAGDEVDAVVALAGLSADQASRLRRRVVAQKAIRTFALTAGDFTVTDELPPGWNPEAAIDVRALILLGARTHLRDDQLTASLAGMTVAKLNPAFADELDQYGFAAADNLLLEALRRGISVPPTPELMPDPHAGWGALYTLAVTGALQGTERTAAPSNAPAPAPAPQAATSSPKPAPAAEAPAQARIPRGTRRAIGARNSPKAIEAVHKLIADRLQLLEADADYFQLLGISESANDDDVRGSYFVAARQLHPDRLAAIGFEDEGRRAHQLFARLNAAFATLSSAAGRAEYKRTLAAGGAEAARAQQEAAEELTRRVLEAEEHYQRAVAAIRQDQPAAAIRALEAALELNPEAEYAVLMTWAQYCVAPNKAAAAAAATTVLEDAIAAMPKMLSAHLYLGKIERLSGNPQKALERFRQAASLARENPEVAAELRALEAQIGRR